MRRIHTTLTVSLATITASAVLSAVSAPVLAAPGSEGASSTAVERRNNNTSEKLRQAASADGAYEHLLALQAIADDNAGTRASGTPGYDASVDYVVERLTAAGYAPTVQDFQFDSFEQLAEPELTVDGVPYEAGEFEYTGSAPDGVTAPVQGVDLALADPASSTSGCTPGDFSSFSAGSIALVQRGVCTFGTKVGNAVAAGAVGVLVMNQGNTPARSGLIENVTLGGRTEVPVIGLSFADGRTIAGLPAPVATLVTNSVTTTMTTYNVLAQTAGRTDNVVVVGAHLDSVLEGPGINDNGSGSAGILEVAEELAGSTPTNAVRFAWWGAEESGLLGSEHYVAELSDQEVEDIALYLNFDMIASPNYARMVYDGDDSEVTGAGPGPDGSGHIEELFTSFFSQLGLNSKATDFSGRSDYGPFIDVDIPSGGLFTGAEEIADDRDAVLFGSTPGTAFDPCYHQACDGIDNIDREVFEQNIDAIAHAVISYGSSTRAVNGERGTEGAGLTRVSGPGGGTADGESGSGGGGLRAGHADHAGATS